jgi:FtsP/CotA-like multicopper oxidase with cupredoxin domain
MGTPEATLGRRAFIKLSGAAALGVCLEPPGATAQDAAAATDPTHALCIRSGQVELGPGRRLHTATFNGQLPGPLLRAAVGQPLRIDIHNDTDTSEKINWQGQNLFPRDLTPIAARSSRRVEFTPQRAGLYLYHSDVIAAARLDSGLYSGLVGGLLVEAPASGHQAEYVVVLKDCEPFLQRTARGYQIGYKTLTVNGRPHDNEGPWGIDTDGPALLHVLNASATEPYTVEVPGRTLEIVSLDGYRVTRPAKVAQLYLAPGERVTARTQSVALVVRAAGAGPVWDYKRFGTGSTPPVRRPDATIDIVLTRHEAARSGLNRWFINGHGFSVAHPRTAFHLEYGRRYRLKLRNSSDEVISLHLQRHQLQIVSMEGQPTAGILKDVVALRPRQRLEVDFVADNPGRAFLHSTRQLQRDFGLMAQIDYT